MSQAQNKDRGEATAYSTLPVSLSSNAKDNLTET